MQIGAVNNVNFGAKAAKTGESKEKGHQRYFEYLSKSSANDALKMSKGREEEDGKFKFATFLTGMTSLIGAYASGMSLLSASSALDVAEEGTAACAKALKKSGRAKTGLLVSGIIGLAALAIRQVNEHKANKTAEERGFMPTKEFYKTKGVENLYAKVENVYDEHVK